MSQNAYEQAEALIAQGEKAKDACASVGIRLSSLYSWRANQKAKHKLSRKPRKRSAKPRHETIDIPVGRTPDGRMIVVYGTIQELIEFARGIA